MKKSIFFLSFIIVQLSQSFSQSFNCNSSDSINNSLVLCMPFNGNAIDESGNGYNGAVSGATLTSDRFGHSNNAYNFNGISNYIDIAKLLPDQTSMSISVWINPTGNTSANGFILFDGNSQCGNDMALLYTNNTIKLVAAKSGALLDGLNFTAQATLPATSFNNWYHIVWSMSPVQSKIYINGVLANKINSTGSNVGYHYAPAIGCFNDGGGVPCGAGRNFFFQGGIDDIRIYNRTLSQSEITRLYNFTYADVPILDKDPAQINIYPNPSNGTLTVQSINTKTDDLFKADFYDVMGKNVKHVEFGGQAKTIDISDLENGIYSVLILQRDATTVRKIILTK